MKDWRLIKINNLTPVQQYYLHLIKEKMNFKDDNASDSAVLTFAITYAHSILSEKMKP
jgi:hypothetical protein